MCQLVCNAVHAENSRQVSSDSPHRALPFARAAAKSGEQTAEEANAPSLPLPSPAPIPEEGKPKPDDNPFAGLFNSCAPPRLPEATALSTEPGAACDSTFSGLWPLPHRPTKDPVAVLGKAHRAVCKHCLDTVFLSAKDITHVPLEGLYTRT